MRGSVTGSDTPSALRARSSGNIHCTLGQAKVLFLAPTSFVGKWKRGEAQARERLTSRIRRSWCGLARVAGTLARSGAYQSVSIDGSRGHVSRGYGREVLPVSILDLAPIVEGGTPAQALRNSLDLAQHAERWGYNRFWVAEHHNMSRDRERRDVRRDRARRRGDARRSGSAPAGSCCRTTRRS